MASVGAIDRRRAEWSTEKDIHLEESSSESPAGAGQFALAVPLRSDPALTSPLNLLGREWTEQLELADASKARSTTAALLVVLPFADSRLPTSVLGRRRWSPAAATRRRPVRCRNRCSSPRILSGQPESLRALLGGSERAAVACHRRGIRPAFRFV